MKTNLHPTDYRPVVFSDDVAGFAFLTQSTAQTTDTIKWEDGNDYPLIKVHISSASHPFFTGEEKLSTPKVVSTATKPNLLLPKPAKPSLPARLKKLLFKKLKKLAPKNSDYLRKRLRQCSLFFVTIESR